MIQGAEKFLALLPVCMTSLVAKRWEPRGIDGSAQRDSFEFRIKLEKLSVSNWPIGPSPSGDGPNPSVLSAHVHVAFSTYHCHPTDSSSVLLVGQRGGVPVPQTLQLGTLVILLRCSPSDEMA